jgi:PAS domain S-box-containing protein
MAEDRGRTARRENTDSGPASGHEVFPQPAADNAVIGNGLFLKYLLNAIPSPIYYKDTEGRYLGLNKSYAALYGRPETEFIGKTIFDFMPRDKAEFFHSKDIELLQDSAPQTFEAQMTDFCGALRNMVFNKATFTDSEGRVSGLIGVIIDITGRKQTEKALQESEDRYRRLVKAVSGYLYTIRMQDGKPDGTEHGTGCLSVTGYTTDEYAANPDLWIQMVHPEDREMVTKHSEKMFWESAPISIEHRIIHKNGMILWIRNTSTPRLNDQGEIIACDGLIENITERKMIEEQLRQSQKLESLGQIAGGVAHDFNNAINAIMGFCTLAQRHVDGDSRAFHYMEDILAVSDRATNITKSLLTFSRNRNIDIKPIDLNKTTVAMGHLLLNLMGADIRLALNISDKELVILGDSGLLDQVMMNLATNARDAMPKGGEFIISTEPAGMDIDFIRTHGYGKLGQYALLSVSDSGTGIDPKTIEKIFEPFFTTKEVGKGTGLGLSISYGIIKQHHGYIDVYSETGKGTTFKIFLPLIRE